MFGQDKGIPIKLLEFGLEFFTTTIITRERLKSRKDTVVWISRD